jgi:hypothetical protein
MKRRIMLVVHVDWGGIFASIVPLSLEHGCLKQVANEQRPLPLLLCRTYENSDIGVYAECCSNKYSVNQSKEHREHG